jgi:solute carrier family 13 (sodium-dependent dicarboxylate transporter), member 2/3/5
MEQGEMGAMASDPLMTDQQAAQLAKIMLAVFFLAVFFWATEALPLGATDLLVAVMLYLFCILPINEISKAYMKDAVFFIFGILAVGVAKTELGEWIGLILLSRIKSAKAFAFIFIPLLAMSASAAW